MSVTQLDHYYMYGDMYETIDACDQLELLLSRLKRQHFLSDKEVIEGRQYVSEIRSRIESHLHEQE